MPVVGLRVLRERASGLVRRAKAGEEASISLAGRPSARPVPVASRSWREWEEVAGLFDGSTDEVWTQDRDRIDGELTDPRGHR